MARDAEHPIWQAGLVSSGMDGRAGSTQAAVVMCYPYSLSGSLSLTEGWNALTEQTYFLGLAVQLII
jgi:hypothetical protein